MEGSRCFNPPTACDDGTLTAPIHEYDHSGPVCESVTGGFVYRGGALPEIFGLYFFADWCSGRFWSFRYEGGILSELVERTAELVPAGALGIGNVSGFGEVGAGELYVVDWGGGAANGEVFRIVADPATAAGRPPEPRSGTLAMLPPRPNPSASGTTIELHQPAAGRLRVWVVSIAGARVRVLDDGPRRAGWTRLTWDGRDAEGARVAAGVYRVCVESGGEVATEAVTVIR
jgi:hypothetical protein